jgi:diguanylate cyclase (GGDEF)-like protein/PAS domain S-box-containing protein
MAEATLVTGMFAVPLAVAGIAACTAAAVACGLAARASRGARPGAWLALGGAAVLWALGTVAALLQGSEKIDGGLLGAAFAAAASLGLLGLLRLHGAPTRVWGQARTVVDGLIVAGSALLIAWTLGLGDSYGGADAEGRLALMRAVADLTIAASAIVTVTRCPPGARPRLGLIAGGFAALAVADSAFTYAALGGALAAFQVLYVGWAAGWVTIGLAATYGHAEADGDQLEPGLPGQASVFVPSAPFALALVAAAAAGARGEFAGFLIWNGAAVIVLIVMRQVLALLENISYWRRLEAKIEARTAELRRSEARFRSLVTNSSDVITVIAEDGAIEYQSPSVRAVLGYRPEELRRSSPIDLVHDEDVPMVLAASRKLRAERDGTTSVEFRLRHRNGGWRHVEAIGSNLVADPGIEGYVVNTRDITERKQLEEQLTHRALHDPLTGLANRALFTDRLGHALRGSMRHEGSTAVLFLDLDDFKNVNDSLGHPVGDELLEEVAKRLFDCVRPADTVARLGGDEFAILLEQSDALVAARSADRILSALEEPFAVAGKKIFVRASIGISTGELAEDDVDELLRTADVAMYTAKERGKGLYEVFDPTMHAALTERLELEQDLRVALDNGEFELRYQPIVSLKTGRIRVLEALLRWRHPERGLLAPELFIQLAEETGLIAPIGRWVLERSCAQMRRWQEQFRLTPPIALAVNLSARQLQDGGLNEYVTTALQRSRLNPGLLVLEITESVLVGDSAPAIERLRELRALGVRVAVDDFGTGYSSLSYLRKLPIDILKIDRAFMNEMKPGSPEAALAEAIVAMSHSLNLTPVAEGIERGDQAAEVVRMGCDLAQGYHFARPVSPKRVAELLAGGGRVQVVDGAAGDGSRERPRLRHAGARVN